MYSYIGKYFPATGTLPTNALVAYSTYPGYFQESEFANEFMDVKNMKFVITVAWAGAGLGSGAHGGDSTGRIRRAHNYFFNAFDPNANIPSSNAHFPVKFFRIAANGLDVSVDLSRTIYNGDTKVPSGFHFWPYVKFASFVGGATVEATFPNDFSGYAGAIEFHDQTWASWWITAESFLTGLDDPVDPDSVSVQGDSWVMEAYSQLYCDKNVAAIGEAIKLIQPAYTTRTGAVFTDSGRDGLKFVRRIWFYPGIAVDINAGMISSTEVGIQDTITVNVPAGAKTGPIMFESRFVETDVDPTLRTENSQQKDDHFTSHFDLIVR